MVSKFGDLSSKINVLVLSLVLKFKKYIYQQGKRVIQLLFLLVNKDRLLS